MNENSWHGISVTPQFQALRQAADDWTTGEADGDTLHSAVVDYTDSVYLTARQQNRAPGQYLVEWSIDAFDCASPREAAEKARAAQVRPGTIFDVTDTMTGEKTKIDLDEQDHDALCSSNITGENRCNCTP